jgi:beta-phosphoglucomutase
MDIKAVLFDMNGIIIDDEHIHEAAFKRTVEPFGITLDHESYLECCAGKTDKEGYESIGKKYQKSLPIDQLFQQKAKVYISLFPTQKKVYPGILECIDRLSKKYTLALTSSSIKWEVELITKEFKIFDKFKVIITGDDVKHGKPHPEPYLLTCKLLGIEPAESIVIEDSSSGVKSAISAGCKCIGITTTHSKDQLLSNSPTVIINSFDEINEKFIKDLQGATS